MKTALIAILLALVLVCPAWAHKSSDAYLEVAVSNHAAVLRLDIALRDLQEVLDLDSNGDGLISWGELRAREKELVAYVSSRLSLASGNTSLSIGPWALAAAQHTDGAYAVLTATSEIPAGTAQLSLRYDLLFDRDAQHRGLASFRQASPSQAAGGMNSFVFGPSDRTFQWNLQAAPAFSFRRFVIEGVHHIWTGYDHMMFLFALLLPAVVLRQPNGQWCGVTGLRPALREVLGVVTAFTAAHSITLFLAAMGWVRLPSRLVESSIAVSVVIAAASNLLPRRRAGVTAENRVVQATRWLMARPPVMAFGFGLVHGFGFASVLSELTLDRAALGFGVLGFNLGVETGQLAVVAVFIPLAYLLRETWFYRTIALQGGSALIVAVAGAWLTERAGGFAFMPF